MSPQANFRKLTAADRIFNRLFAFAVGLGAGFRYNYLLEVKGRKSGHIFTTPVNLLEIGDRRFLVSSRGESQWVRNARAAGRIALRRARQRIEFDLRELPAADRAPLLKEFLDRFAASVQRFYPIPKGSPVESFVPLADSMPVFELIPVSTGPRSR